ncbi:MAG: hypothetical protein LBK53_03850 [Heliobacteriaceae bacterium]|nr:hypothetical protein [Heliobacteriaceae bacterium]
MICHCCTCQAISYMIKQLAGWRNYSPLETLPNETIADSVGRETPIVRKTTLFRTAGNPRQSIVSWEVGRNLPKQISG